jgi:polar amino acid transport system permease protein
MHSERPPIRHNTVSLPPWVDRAAAAVARWPWWLIIIGIGLTAVFYSILTNDFFRRVLVFVTDNPRLITDQFTNVVYDVRGPEGQTVRIRGTVTAQDGESVTVLTQPEVLVIIPREDLTSLSCEQPNPDGDCPIGQRATALRGSISGRLLLEDVGRFQVATDYGVVVDVRKITVDQTTQVRDPEGCSATPNGTCRITLNLNPEAAANTVEGLLVEADSYQVGIQVAPPISTTLNRTDILAVVNAEPAQCALNNIAACNEGIFLTLGVTVAAFMLAIMLGLIFGLMRISGNPVFFNVATVYVEVVRGVPLLVILLFVNFAFAPWFRDEFPNAAGNVIQFILLVGGAVTLYYLIARWSWRRIEPAGLIQPVLTTVIITAGLAALMLYLRGNSDLTPVQRGILGLAFGYGAFLAELFRAGIQSIGRGQMEAARSLGMNYLQAMRYIILPQAFRVVLPPLGNEFIAILKDTSLIAILALPELTQKARLFAADTFRPFEPYITIGFLYLCMTLFLSFVVRVVERRIALPK